MDMEKIKQNKPAIFVSVLALLLVGVAISAQIDKNPTNDLKTAFQKKITVPSGAQLSATLNSTISSESSNVGDIVVATLSQPVLVGNDLIFPSGSKVFGKVSYLERAVKEGAVMSGAVALAFDKLELPGGSEYNIDGSIPVQRAENAVTYENQVVASTGKQKLAQGATKTVLGAASGAALGTAVGAIAGGGRGAGRGAWSGAAIGGGVGAAAGVYGAANDKGRVVAVKKEVGQDIVIPSGQDISVTLNQAVQTVPVPLG